MYIVVSVAMETITVNEANVGEVVSSQASELDPSTHPVTIVHVAIPNQPVQVQSVIQQPASVIQSAGGTIQTIQVGTQTFPL